MRRGRKEDRRIRFLRTRNLGGDRLEIEFGGLCVLEGDGFGIENRLAIVD